MIYEKKERQIEYEERTEPKLDNSLFKKKGNSKTFKGYMIQKMKEARNLNNLEMVWTIQHFYKKYLEFESKIMVPLVEIEIIEGWKGKDKLNMSMGFNSNFSIIEHRKEKETGEVHDVPHLIPFENVNKILCIINKLKINESIPYRKVISRIIKMNDLQLGLNAFNGGKNRSKYYFPLYYFPVKILESLNFIDYSGRGVITRIK